MAARAPVSCPVGGATGGLGVWPRLRPPRWPRLAALVRPALAGLARCRGRRLAHPGDGLADQLLDRGDRLVVARRHDRDGDAAAAGAAGAADAVDVIVGVMRHVEIEDVADRRDVEAARRDVGGDQQRDLAVAELERRRARRLVHVAVQATAEKPCCSSERCSSATSRLRLQKMMAFLKPSAVRIRRRSVSRLSSGSRPVLDQKLRDGRGGGGAAARPRRAPDCAGNCSVMRWISGGMVAVKNSVWRVNGTSLQMRSMSGMKPMSSMRSASSMTSSSTPVSSRRPRSK